nr:hypothetical protein HmN_000995800 [Hymenolepis microstoma]
MKIRVSCGNYAVSQHGDRYAAKDLAKCACLEDNPGSVTVLTDAYATTLSDGFMDIKITTVTYKLSAGVSTLLPLVLRFNNDAIEQHQYGTLHALGMHVLCRVYITIIARVSGGYASAKDHLRPRLQPQYGACMPVFEELELNPEAALKGCDSGNATKLAVRLWKAGRLYSGLLKAGEGTKQRREEKEGGAVKLEPSAGVGMIELGVWSCVQHRLPNEKGELSG